MMALLPTLPVEGAQGEGLRILVLAIASLLLIICPLALARSGREAGRVGPMLACAAIALTLGAAFFVHDAVSLPEVTGTLAVGSGIGYMLVRHANIEVIARLVAAVMGLAGLGGFASGVALWLDPRALGLVAMPDTPLPGLASLVLLAITALSLVQACIAAYLLMRQAATRVADLVGLARLGGAACFLLGGVLGSLPMILVGTFVVAGATGLRMARG